MVVEGRVAVVQALELSVTEIAAGVQAAVVTAVAVMEAAETALHTATA